MSSAVVIGASGGIGAAFVRALEDEGTFGTVHAFARSFSGAGHLDLEDEASIAAAAAIVAKGPAPTLILSRPACSTKASVARRKRSPISTRYGSHAISRSTRSARRSSPSTSCR